MVYDISATWNFFSSTIGILLSTVLFVAALISGVKYLNNKLDERIDNNVNKKVGPLIQGLCNQISELSTAMKTHQASTLATMESLNNTQKFLQDLITKK